jgi:hypothetical protein
MLAAHRKAQLEDPPVRRLAFAWRIGSWSSRKGVLAWASLACSSRNLGCDTRLQASQQRKCQRSAVPFQWSCSKDPVERSRGAKSPESDDREVFRKPHSPSSERDAVVAKSAKEQRPVTQTTANVVEGGHNEERNDRGAPADSLAALQEDLPLIRQIFGADTFFPTEDVVGKRGVVYRGNLRNKPDEVYRRLAKRLESLLGDRYILSLLEGDENGRAFVLIEPNGTLAGDSTARPFSVKKEDVLTIMLALLFCILTGMTIFLRVGTILGPEYGEIRRITFQNGVKPVFFSFFSTLIAAQLLQRLLAWKYRCSVGTPILLPSPQLGSFGSVYHLDQSPPDRKALFDIAMASGGLPFIVSILIFTVGVIMTSFAVGLPLASVHGSLMNVRNFVYVPEQWIYRDSFLLGLIARALLSVQPVTLNAAVAADQQLAPLVLVHPLVLVGATLMQISALSLLPLRQLDGWRILTAIFGRRAASLLSRFTVLYLLIGAARYPYLLLFLTVILFGPWKLDRQCRNEISETDRIRQIVGYIVIVIMIFAMCPYSK